MTPEQHELLIRIHEYTLRHEGEPVLGLTAAELDAIAAGIETLWAKNLADVDRARACAAEVRECGCTIRIPLQPDGGQRDIGRAVVHHTCGRSG